MRAFQRRQEPMTAMQLVPDRSLRNYSVESIAKAMAEFYSRPLARLSLTGKQVNYQAPDRFVFRILLQHNSICFYLLVPARLADHFKQKVQAVWERATIIQDDHILNLDPAKCKGCELVYRRHDMFSLATDRDTLAPLPGILSAVTEMQPGELALVDILLTPTDSIQWEYDAGRAYEVFSKGKMPRRLSLDAGTVLIAGMGGFNGAMTQVQQAIVEGMGGQLAKVIRPLDPEREMLAIRGLTAATTSKLHSATLKTNIHIIAESKDHQRAELFMRTMAGAYKDISADNELVRRDIKNMRSLCEAVRSFRPHSISGITCSAAEAVKLMQLPTAGLQDEYPQIQSIKQREVSLPGELFYDVPGIVLGDVTERGVTRTARVPVVEIPGVQQKHVYDALCTPTMGTGQMGTGKTDGFGGNWVHGFLLNGFTVFVIDTADGQILRNLEDALPVDYPDEKIIHLELDNKHWPIALNWGDTASRRLAGAEDELEALEMGERLTARLIDYIDSNATTELTDRMRQYLTSAARITLADPAKSLLDVELALRSPAYREELLQNKLLKEMPEVAQDLQTLQGKAATGGDASIIDPIISRLKMFTESRALQNIFYQPNKLKSGRPVLDFRHYADNPTGGYGYLVSIHASSDAWGPDGQELVLSFAQDKILMAVYSRVDVPQDQRKPALNLIDEPHRFIKKAARLYKDASVELRKYRLKLLWLAHYMSQMGPAAQAVAAGGCQFTSYKTQDLKQFMELGHVFEPYEPQELYKTLPEKWAAVNKVRLPSGQDCPAFIAKMAPPPDFVRSREERRQQCAREFGRHWKEVGKEIQEKRLRYQKLDEAWRDENTKN